MLFPPVHGDGTAPRHSNASVISVAWTGHAGAVRVADTQVSGPEPQRVQPSKDARAAISGLEKQMTGALNARDDADKVSNAQVLLVVNAVKGDPAEGEDGELYEAMGYMRNSERKSGLRRGATLAKAA